MALDINGYNDAFRAFADFAAKSVNAGDSKAIARASADVSTGALAGREIKAATTDSIRHMFKWFRSADDQKANNATREIFWNSIIDMFGGESKIPASVKDAMRLADYDKGKPLTARRILAVKAAIDADGTAKTRYTTPETFKSPEVKTAALGLGFTNGELPKLARVAHLYAQATGLSEMDAMKAVAEPNSKPNRLMQYGGRFLDNAENFKNGLRLMDSFKDWFTGVRETKNAGDKTFANARTLTDLNFNSDLATHDASAAFERFVFEELAVNDAHDLSGTDPEKLFGVKDNAAMRFFATDRCYNFVGVMANVPPERRGAIYAVLDKLSLPLAQTKDEAHSHEGMSRAERSVHNPHIVIGRILRHLPEIERLASKDALTEKNIVKTLFPDLPTPNWTRSAVNEFTHYVDWTARDILMAEDKDLDDAEATSAGGKIQLIMEETCCTLQEGIAAYKKGKRVSPPQYMTTATFSIEKLDGTTAAARDQLDGNKMGDLWRPYNYGAADDPGNKDKLFIKDAADMAFGFTFPDGTSLKANAVQHAGNIPTIVDKLESLAGKVHPRQQSALMFAVSQSGLGVLKGGLEPYGISASEHAAVNFSLSKNAETGTITVKYESPEKLPVYFSWTATIDVDGNVTATPIHCMGQGQLKSSVDEAAANMQKPNAPKAELFQKTMADARPLLDRMMRATGGDQDLINLLKDETVCARLLFDSLDKLRPASVVQARVEAFKENVAELREATKGNPLMFKMGLERIKSFGGKPIPKGMLSTLVKAVNAEKIDKLKKLSVSTARTPDKLHGAVAQYHTVLTNVIKNSGVMNMFDGDVGGEEMLSVEMLVGGLLVGRCGESALRAMKGALSSPVTGQLQSVYNDLDLKNFLKDPDLPPMSHAEANILSRTGGELQHNLSSMLYDVYEALGDEQVEIKPFEGNLNDLDGLPEIFDDVRNMTQTLHADLVERERRDLRE